MKTKTLFVFLLIINHLFGQSLETTEVIVIGNPHTNNTYYNAKVVDSLLTNIQPDLILVEFDSSFFNSEFSYDTIKHPQLLKRNSSPNTIGTNNYVSKHKSAIIRPFDISGRNDSLRKHEYFTIKPKMYDAIFKSAHKGLLSPRNERDFILLAKSLYSINTLKIESLKQLNSNFLANLMFLQQNVYLNSAINITETTDSLKKYNEFANWQAGFWEKRNDIMVKNISYFINTKQYKRIVILTGNMHIFYIKEGLKRKEGYKTNFVIKEFRDY